jgi:hypothetical protein
MLASASAAALATLAVTVAVPAIADNAPDPNGEDALAACLRDHGLDGAPDGVALKPWLGARLERGDATAKKALEDCAPKPDIVRSGPSEQELRSCLKDHGVEVPGGDALALKRWIAAHGDDVAYRDAMKACDMAPVTKRAAVECAKPGAAALGIRPGRAGGEVPSLESGSASVNEADAGN